MSFKAYTDGLLLVLRSDADLNAWAQTNYQSSFTQLKGFREIELINHDELPAQLIYPFSGEINPEGLGNHSTLQAPEVIVEWVFNEDDPDRAFDLQGELIDLVPRAVARDRTLQGAALMCYATEWRPNDPRLHPSYSMAFKISGEYNLLTA